MAEMELASELVRGLSKKPGVLFDYLLPAVAIATLFKTCLELEPPLVGAIA